MGAELRREMNRYIHYYNHSRYQWGLKKMALVQYKSHLLSTAFLWKALSVINVRS